MNGGRMKARGVVATALLAAMSCGHVDKPDTGQHPRLGENAVPAISGKVLSVRGEINLVMISVGSDDGVRPGYRFWVYRDGQRVGEITTEKVFKDMSAARIFEGSWRQPLQKGDDVSTALYEVPSPAE